jgi:hypothetical protein
LDTLCNALGGILFIALLVVLLAHQVPVLESTAPAELITESDMQKLEMELKHLPSVPALEAQLDSYEATLAAYTQSDLEAVTTELDQDSLLRERERLKALPAPATRPTTSYRVPAIQQSQNMPEAYIVIFREGKVYSAAFSAATFSHSGEMLTEHIHFRLGQQGVIQIKPLGKGSTVSIALRELDQAIRTKNIHKDKAKLYLYTYPDSVELLQNYRKQAMRRIPHAIWSGISEDSLPQLIFTQQTQSDISIGF